MISENIDLGISYLKAVTSGTREMIEKIISYTGFDGRLGVIILMLAFSIILGNFIARRYVTKPWSGTYFLFTGLISLMWFIILVYI
jgi:hypothetical protein